MRPRGAPPEPTRTCFLHTQPRVGMFWAPPSAVATRSRLDLPCSFIFEILFVSNLHTQLGARTHSPEINTHTLYGLSRPGAPGPRFSPKPSSVSSAQGWRSGAWAWAGSPGGKSKLSGERLPSLCASWALGSTAGAPCELQLVPGREREAPGGGALLPAMASAPSRKAPAQGHLVTSGRHPAPRSRSGQSA